MKPANPALLFIVATFLALLPLAGTSAYRQTLSNSAATVPTIPCDVRAYVIDHDAGGLNVRSGPGKSFKTIGNIPNQGVDGVGVHITGASGEWIRIDKALEEGADQPRTFFSGEGWVYAALLGVSGMAITNGGTNLYQNATRKSRVVVRIPGGDDEVVIRGCRGGWMFIEYKKKKGWAAPDTLCANSLTTCV